MGEETSIKQLFQGMADNGIEVLQGTVQSVSPLEIQIAGDEKRRIGEGVTCVPRHLTDYETEISFDDPGIKQAFTTWDMGESQESPQQKISFKGKTKHKVTVYNALKVGDVLFILSFNHGKQYYLLDKVG